MAEQVPDHPAVVVARPGGRTGQYDRITFRELDALTNRYANGLTEAGIARAMRTLVMVKPGIDFIALMFALLKMGAVPVLIDPGMGVRRMLSCVSRIEPKALIGIPAAHAAKNILRGSLRSVRIAVTVGRRWFWGGPTLADLAGRAGNRFDIVESAATDPAAILFTSGATGPAKGVIYEHGMFCSQARQIQSQYGIEPGEVDLSCFPLFALFCPALGMTSVIPDMNASRPARADPAKLVAAIEDNAATSTFGSPAVWERVSEYCIAGGTRLPTLRRVLIAGAPVSWRLIEKVRRILPPGADVHTPYGATESLPVASIGGSEVTDHTASRTRQGAGICVGLPVPGIQLRIVRITDEPIPHWSENLILPDGEIGEVVVRGEVVTKEYAELPQATASAKIRDGDAVWHRMGDVGYLDDGGRLWYCGRKAHRVTTPNAAMFSIPCEAIFNEHPNVRRCALVGVGPRGNQQPAVVIEPRPGRFPRESRRTEFIGELLQLGGANELTQDTKTFLFHKSLPVDVRHNAKINREKLAAWAAERLR